MPRYFFSLENSRTHNDVDGTLLPDDHAARVAAVMYLAESLRSEPDLVGDDHRLAVVVRNDTGEPLMRMVVTAEGPIAGA